MCGLFWVLGGAPALGLAAGDQIVEAPPEPVLVLRGGVVLMTGGASASADTVVIRGNKIAWVGRAAERPIPKGPHVHVVELRGRCVVPGFIESHGHLLMWGRQLISLDLSDAEDWDAIVERVAEACRKAKPGTWVVGRGWHQEKWKRRPAHQVEGYPVRDAIDRVSAGRPVLLLHGTGHMALANGPALQAAGIGPGTPDPPGGRVLRDESGRATGVLRENAMDLVLRVYERWRNNLPAAERRAERERAILAAARACLRLGITSFQDAGVTLEDLDVYRSLADHRKLPIRLYAMLYDENDVLRSALAKVRIIGAGHGFLTVRAIKRMYDGALGTHGAWMLLPYEDLPGRTGLRLISPGALEETARLAVEHDYQLCVHAIGDRANREVLDIFERVLGSADEARKRRWRIEHAQHLDPADIPRFGKLGIIASMQGVHATSDGPFVVRRLGIRRAREGAYAWRSLLDAGAIIINGTDVPVEPADPIDGLYALVTRRMANGEAFFPEQAMTPDEALASYTRWPAWGAFEENLKGEIAPGKLADLVVLSANPLACMRAAAREPDGAPPEDGARSPHASARRRFREKLRVEMTIVDGRIVFEAEAR